MCLCALYTSTLSSIGILLNNIDSDSQATSPPLVCILLCTTIINFYYAQQLFSIMHNGY